MTWSWATMPTASSKSKALPSPPRAPTAFQQVLHMQCPEASLSLCSSALPLNAHSRAAAPGYDVVNGLGSINFKLLSSMLPSK
jgi:hypothetical protein